jgi:esterase/lipase
LKHPTELPDDLEDYLRDRESRFADIVPGAEKKIVWADPVRRQATPYSIIYLHGFSATRQETHPLAEILGARLGANLFYTRLTGHGRGRNAMGSATVEDWLADAEEALAIGRRLGDKVIVIGVSTGAILAVWLTARAAAGDILADVLISPNFNPRASSARILTWPGGSAIARMLLGPYRQFEPTSPAHGKYWTTTYPTKTLVTMMTLLKRVRKVPIASIEVPVLVLYSRKDTVVDPREIEKRFQQWGSRRKRLIEIQGAQDPSHHVLAGDILSPNTTGLLAEYILGFVSELTSAP